MKRYTKDNEIKYANRIVVIKDGMQIINPTEEQILADGWVEYVAPTPEPPTAEEEIEAAAYGTRQRLMTMMFEESITSKINTYELTDKEALSVKELYPKWKEGIEVKVGEKYGLNEKLYQVVQAHTTQDNWRPDRLSSLWVEVSYHAGTKADPIPYNEDHNPQFQGMVLELGKIYTQDGILYECIRDSQGVKIVQDLAGLVGNYVKVVK